MYILLFWAAVQIIEQERSVFVALTPGLHRSRKVASISPIFYILWYKLSSAFDMNKAALNMITLLAILVIVVVVVVLFVSGTLNISGVRRLNGVTTLAVNGSTPILVNSNEYIMSVAKASNGKAYLYMAQSPIFLSQMLNITLSMGNATKVNLNSKQANVEITLVSVGTNSAVITMAPLPQYLELAADSADIRVINVTSSGTYSGAGLQQNAGSSNSTTVATTTVAASHNTSTTVSSVTTTVTHAQSLNSKIYAALNGSSLYPLMLNYSKLYANTQNCTMLQYDNLYVAQYGTSPPGAVSYWNVSHNVPYAMALNITSGTGGTDTATFRVKTTGQDFNNTVAVSIVVNPSLGSVVSQNISKTGIFSGLAVSDIAKGYNTARALGGACGIYIG